MSVFVKTDNKGTLNMRANPSMNSPVLAKIPYGTEIPAEKIDDTWAKTRYKDQEGYVMMKYLSTQAVINDSVSKSDLQKIYNSLKSTLQTIEEVLK